jgi:peptidoglycan/LPS O-acetylase OafA/YrhL
MLFSRLQRITRDGHWIPEIDGLRFIAIFSVFLFHLGTELSGKMGLPPHGIFFVPIRTGLRGVQLFFTISSFVLALPFARAFLAGGKKVSLRKYYLRRLTRIEPPYLIALAGCTILYALYHHAWHAALVHAAVSVVYLHSLVYGNTSLVNGVLWSLEVEVQFYLIAPLLMLVYRLRSFGARLGIYAVLATLSLLAEIYLRTPRIDLSLPSALIYFVMGLLVADMYISSRSRSSALLHDAVGLAALVLFFGVPEAKFFWLGPLCTYLLCLGALQGGWLRRVLSMQGLAVTGGMCYSIYLWHLKLMEIVLLVTRHAILPQLGYAGNYLLQLVLVGAPVLLLCIVFFVLVERPCMDPKWPVKLWHAITKRRPAEMDSLDTSGVS